jgi:hypothetical protein
MQIGETLGLYRVLETLDEGGPPPLTTHSHVEIDGAISSSSDRLRTALGVVEGPKPSAMM